MLRTMTASSCRGWPANRTLLTTLSISVRALGVSSIFPPRNKLAQAMICSITSTTLCEASRQPGTGFQLLLFVRLPLCMRLSERSGDGSSRSNRSAALIYKQSIDGTARWQSPRRSEPCTSQAGGSPPICPLQAFLLRESFTNIRNLKYAHFKPLSSF